MHFLTGRRYRVPEEGLVVIQDRSPTEAAMQPFLIESLNRLPTRKMPSIIGICHLKSTMY